MKTERRTAEASAVYRRGRWTISVDGSVIGQSDSLGGATDVLYENGYKVHTYRRHKGYGDRTEFRATVLCFTPKQDD